MFLCLLSVLLGMRSVLLFLSVLSSGLSGSDVDRGSGRFNRNTCLRSKKLSLAEIVDCSSVLDTKAEVVGNTSCRGALS